MLKFIIVPDDKFIEGLISPISLVFPKCIYLDPLLEGISDIDENVLSTVLNLLIDPNSENANIVSSDIIVLFLTKYAIDLMFTQSNSIVYHFPIRITDGESMDKFLTGDEVLISRYKGLEFFKEKTINANTDVHEIIQFIKE